MKYKKGDKVRVKRFKKTPANWNSDGKMNHLMGKIVKIDSVSSIFGGIFIHDDLCDRAWLVDESQVEPLCEEKKPRFKVGDRVKCVNDGRWSKDIVGKFGNVVKIYNPNSCEPIYSVEFDEYIDGHACDGKAKDGHGWNCEAEMLELVKDETIVIYRKDKEVVALDKRTGKKGIARCCPEDTFNFETGAKLAFDRLLVNDKFGAPEHIYKVGDKVKVIDTGKLYTTYSKKVELMTDDANVLARYAYNKYSGDCGKTLSGTYTILAIDDAYVLVAKNEGVRHGEVLLIGEKGLMKC